jgi:hypothetical protein
MAKGVLGGIEPDPDAGTPYRKVRARAQLMLGTLTSDQQKLALELLIVVRPEEALDALIFASGEN